MGNASSQSDAVGHDEQLNKFNASQKKRTAAPKSPTATKKVKRDAKPAGSTSTQKRKALSDSANDNTQRSLPSPPNESSGRPAKRNKVSEPKQKPTRNRNRKALSTVKDRGKTNDAPIQDAAPAQQHTEPQAVTSAEPEPEPEVRSNASPSLTEEENVTSTPGSAAGTEGPDEKAVVQPGFRKGKHGVDSLTGEKKEVGFFKPHEVQKLEKFKLDFCTNHGLSSGTFDLMIQHSERDRLSIFPCHSNITTKTAFWKDIYSIIPGRDRRSVYRFMRRHFQGSSQKPHHWTEEQDDELVLHHERHGPKWAFIAKMLGRSDDDVVQRWKNRLQHRKTMNRGPWSEQEVRSLLELLQASWDGLKGTEHELDLGRDIYEMDESLIAWGHISDKMKNCRSRQQCADKWRKIRRKIAAHRCKKNPDAFYDPIIETRLSIRRSKLRAATRQSDKQFKSAEFVKSDDDSDADPDEGTEATPTAAQSVGKIDKRSSSGQRAFSSAKAKKKHVSLAPNGASKKNSIKSISDSDTDSDSYSVYNSDSESDLNSDSGSESSESQSELDADSAKQQPKKQQPATTHEKPNIKSEDTCSSESEAEPLRETGDSKDQPVVNGARQRKTAVIAGQKAKAPPHASNSKQQNADQPKVKYSLSSSESKSEDSETSDDSEPTSPAHKRGIGHTSKPPPSTKKPVDRKRKANPSFPGVKPANTSDNETDEIDSDNESTESDSDTDSSSTSSSSSSD
ncbi:hypothetical protein BO70DRAFT_365648 [Aspergillus heteromorphus CBS 117.55]|uniref:MYB DNA-binding domain protein n=1 Tax=Aspergillus heteromorphus CBS 117.55 TaxID=1448321 RepID=A0A317VCX4_9EURO|nr:uncharacterized protein BO70DRAFT_365648 [Aspergillus heteromorphus CBS 117.55]PWY69720.1 hypothetical protein BO70DRAFT_365648 [Aspergillus heteromorphus CBS 117.55]